MKKLSRSSLKSINGSSCPGGCPTPPATHYGPPGSGAPYSCQAYFALSDCCKATVIVDWRCVPLTVE